MSKRPHAKLLLPRKPSSLIRRALADLEKTERQKSKYYINMQYYHSPDPSPKGQCAVCFAGTTIAQSGTSHRQYIETGDFPEKTANKLRALDAFRLGKVTIGLYHMGLVEFDTAYAGVFDDPKRVYVPHYHIDPVGFKKTLHALADHFEAEGK